MEESTVIEGNRITVTRIFVDPNIDPIVVQYTAGELDNRMAEKQSLIDELQGEINRFRGYKNLLVPVER